MVKAAIILAAGIGTRLRISKPKSIVELGGFKLFQLPLISLRFIGLKKFYVVTQPRAYLHIEKALKQLKVDYEVIINTEVERENGYSLHLGLKAAKEEVLFVSMSDHIYPPELPYKLLEHWNDNLDLLIGGDRSPQLVDVDEATKILIGEDGELLAISKRLERWTYIDVGVFIVNRKRLLKITSDLARSKKVFRMSQVIMESAKRGYRLAIGDVTGVPWLDVDTPNDLKKLRNGEAKILVDSILSRVEVVKFGVGKKY